MGINNSTAIRLQRSINSSESEVFKKKATFELAKDNYTKECIKLHALRKVNVMFMNALKVREQINEDKDNLKRDEITLNKRKRSLRLSSASVCLDGPKNMMCIIDIDDDDDEVLDCGNGGGDGGGGSSYNTGVDKFMNDS